MDAKKANFSQRDFYKIAKEGASNYIFSQTANNQ